MAERPWTDPRPGDVCTTAAGRKRTVAQVSYRNWRVDPHPDRRPGDWIDHIVYQAGGATRTCEGTTWASWCRAAVAGGGAYRVVARG